MNNRDGSVSDSMWALVIALLFCIGALVVFSGKDEGDKVCYQGHVVGFRDDYSIMVHTQDGLASVYSNHVRFSAGDEVVLVRTLYDLGEWVHSQYLLAAGKDASHIEDVCRYTIPER